MGEPRVVQSMPDCDFCIKEGIVRPSIVDAMTDEGAFAFMCDEDRKVWSVGRRLPPGEHPDETLLVLQASVGKQEGRMTAREREAYVADALRRCPAYPDLVNMLLVGPCKAVDGCECKPDGYCSHGLPSWFVALGIA